MEYEFSDKFIRDLKSFRHDKEFVHLLGAKINETIKAKSLKNIGGLVSIRKTKVHYRLKIKSSKEIYRIGLKLLNNVIWFSCIDSNKKRFYKRFP